MAAHADRLPRIVRDDGSLDPFSLQEALHVLHNTGLDTKSVAQQALGIAQSASGEIGKLKEWRQKMERASAFADGVLAGRSKVLGVLDRSMVLAFGVIGSLGGLFGAAVAAHQAGVF